MPKAERVRLLVCHHCTTIQEIPWCGEDPQCGHPGCVEPLEYRIAEHRFGDGRPHAPANLADIDKAMWDKYSTRQDVILQLQRIVDPGAGAGLGQGLYDVKSNFIGDAARCWKKHKRTQDCADYKTAKMRLVPDTKAERKDLGLETRARHIPTSTFLCDFCPMKSIMQTRVNSEKFGFNSPY